MRRSTQAATLFGIAFFGFCTTPILAQGRFGWGYDLPAPGHGGYPVPPYTSRPISGLFPGSPPPALGGPSFPGQYPGASPLVALSGELAARADEFLAYMIRDGQQVPEQKRFAADAARLRNAAQRMSQAAISGAPPNALIRDFKAVASSWGRLESRMRRVNRGRIGPNIAHALQMGQTIEQIGLLLGV